MRKQWTDDDVISDLKNICAGFGRMVTVSDLKEIGRNDLSCVITRRGGFEVFANKIGYSMPDSDSHFGWKGEAAVAKVLEGRGYLVERMLAKKAPFDILINQVARIDVKTASYAEYGRSTGWFYRIGKICPADIIVLYQFDTTDMYLIPWTKCPASNITITKRGSRYETYKNNFDVLDQAINACPWKPSC